MNERKKFMKRKHLRTDKTSKWESDEEEVEEESDPKEERRVFFR